MHNQKQQRPAVQRALSFADDGCNKSFSKDGKDGKLYITSGKTAVGKGMDTRPASNTGQFVEIPTTDGSQGSPSREANARRVASLKQSIEIDIMQFIYIKETFRFLVEDFRKGIDNEY